MAWWLWPRPAADRPDLYDVGGAHPGDLRPGLDIEDNVRHYGLDMDLPYRFHTNALGFRGPEPRTGTRRTILVLGDSFAFGMGVDDGQTFADSLRAELPDATVLNAAVPGYTITDQREQWSEKLAALKPAWVLLCHTASDLKEMARPTSFRRFARWDDEDPAAQDAEVARIVAQAGGDKAAATRQHYVFSQASLRDRVDAAGLRALLQRYVDGVLALDREVRAAGGRLLLVLWVRGYGLGGLDTAPLVAAARAAGIPVFDADTAMRTQGGVPMDRLYLPDKHFSAEGNRLTARQTAAFLRGLP